MPASWFKRVCLCTAFAAGAVASGTAVASDDAAARRLQIAQMSPGDQQELLRKQERFLALPASEQNRLRALQASIDADPHAKELLHVMARYHEWLKTLSPSERAQLGELPPDKRVKRIKEIQQKQHATRLQQHRAQLLSSQDMHAIVKWSEDVVWAHRDSLLADLPEPRRKAFEAIDPKKQHHALLLTVLDRSRRGGGPHALTAIHTKDIETLQAQLGEPARQELAKESSLQEQRKIVIGWIRVAMQQRAESWQASRRASRWWTTTSPSFSRTI